MKNRSFYDRMQFALSGIAAGWRREKSFRTQAGIAVLVIAGLVVFGVPAVWCAVVMLAAALVLAAELFNAALEALIDHLHPDLHPEIGVVKDMAAGGVLLVAGAAAAIGVLMIFAIR